MLFAAENLKKLPFDGDLVEFGAIFVNYVCEKQFSKNL